MDTQVRQPDSWGLTCIVALVLPAPRAPASRQMAVSCAALSFRASPGPRRYGRSGSGSGTCCARSPHSVPISAAYVPPVRSRCRMSRLTIVQALIANDAEVGGSSGAACAAAAACHQVPPSGPAAALPEPWPAAPAGAGAAHLLSSELLALPRRRSCRWPALTAAAGGGPALRSSRLVRHTGLLWVAPWSLLPPKAFLNPANSNFVMFHWVQAI